MFLFLRFHTLNEFFYAAFTGNIFACYSYKDQYNYRLTTKIN